jgi:hypothetical protein
MFFPRLFLLLCHQVIRIYDTRFRECQRSPHVYLALDEGTIILKLQSNDNATSKRDPCYGEDDFWTWSNKKLVRFMEVEYRKGIHSASRPTHFLPIIAHLQYLHARGFVHGDIRAFNTVFDYDKDDDSKIPRGRLIDLDFSGRDGKATYPDGYKQSLVDGTRIGNGETSVAHVLQMWHDWYAMGRLIFDIHKLVPPKGHAHDKIYWRSLQLKEFWLDLERCPLENEIDNLKKMLSRLDCEGWTVQPNQLFGAYLEGGPAKPGLHTMQGATSSPIK